MDWNPMTDGSRLGRLVGGMVSLFGEDVGESMICMQSLIGGYATAVETRIESGTENASGVAVKL
ncbi:hypothetical protein RSSM_01390 [Rhodopirellula sallentina SM41]|uniref:Uncharacterized protein n=1 Tax=Rhodopirellula sallentina SM41 TaxID=1263870 RepID=M5U6R6_9BACT|nr:hypothetical protein RSSM_01390 [Rhodopirellula sallentina SM41]